MMISEDGMVSKLLSLRFHAFGNDDRRALEKNVENGSLRGVVSEAARIYLREAIRRDDIDLYRLEDIRDWLTRNKRGVSFEVLDQYNAAISTLHRGEPLMQEQAYEVMVPRF